MSESDFITVKIQIGKRIQNAKMEKGTVFENKSCIFTAGENNEVLNMTNYQMQVFQAVANNVKEEGEKGIVLSKRDIDIAIKLYGKGMLGNDMSAFLTSGYSVQNPKAFKDENKISAYITNGNKNTSAVICFKYIGENIDKVQKQEKKDSLNRIAQQSSKASSSLGKTFTNPNIIKHNSIEHVVSKGETLIDIGKKYEVDTYQLIAANPQLKKGSDYNVTFRKNNIALVSSNLSAGQKIIIPPRYSVKEGSVKNFNDLCKITGLSECYIKDLLTIIEVSPKHPGKPDLTTYNDGYGTPTIGYGHTGKVDGKQLSLNKKIKITETKALQLLAEDLIKHEAMVIAYLGEKNYDKAPVSVKAAIVDVAYNKGIWDGFLNPYHNSATSKIKQNLEKGNFVSALCNTRRMETPNRGLKRRNIYRFISGLTDLTPAKREAAMKEMQPYYNFVLKGLKGAEYKYLQNAWSNAKLGKTTGYRIQCTQKDEK